MFSLILITLFYIGVKSIRNNSKPTDIFLNPVAAKTEMLDKYLKIESMPDGASKQKAYKQWQKECQRLNVSFNPKFW